MRTNQDGGRGDIPSRDIEGLGTKPPVVLIVDDNADACRIYDAVLRHAGFATLCAHDGSEALDIVGSEVPDFVVMDVSMPGMDGIAATRAIREQARGGRLHIVASTANDLTDAEWRAAGFDGYLQKPLSPVRLAAYVTGVLAG